LARSAPRPEGRSRLVLQAQRRNARSPHVDNPELHTTDRPVIHTLEGVLTASPGDWIIKGVQGEFYPCKPDIFEATYEAA
jgi:hypothetical protein